MLVYVFPGQGSQRRGMGQDLFDQLPAFGHKESDLDEVLGYSIRELCVTDPDNRLGDTRYTQPSMYVVNALHYFQAMASGGKPAAVAGHSLGEYNALLAAGAFDFLTGLRLVKRRAELMSQARNGGMAAVVGLDANRIAAILLENKFSDIDIANFNAPLQTVVSGPVETLKLAGPKFEAAGANLFSILPVSAAFHSRYMVGAAQDFDEFLADFEFERLQLPVIANTTGLPYAMDNPTDTVRALLVRQIAQPVRWVQSVRYLCDQGDCEFKELGHGMAMTRLVDQIRKTLK